MPAHRVLATAALVCALSTACVPATESATGEPAAGCRRPTAGGPDVGYSGEPSEYDNLRYWTSRDGTCSGSVARYGTLMVAPTAGDAAFLCDALLRAEVDGRIDQTQGPWSVPFGPMGYVCAVGP